MYAARRLYVKQWDHQSPDERYSVHVAKGGKPVPGIKPERIVVVEEELMYWRKANHIHGWFVEHVQDGNDDCRDYYVGWDDLEQLLELCSKVIEASKLVDGQVIESWTVGENDERINHWVPGKVIEDPTVAKALLPRTPGFFFGSEEYDEDYLKDVTETRDWIVRMLADNAAGVPGSIYYSSSW